VTRTVESIEPHTVFCSLVLRRFFRRFARAQEKAPALEARVGCTHWYNERTAVALGATGEAALLSRECGLVEETAAVETVEALNRALLRWKGDAATSSDPGTLVVEPREDRAR